ncbi:MAG: methyltransferase domain-containing protein [Rhodothalassiaceae bacterium]
MRPDVIALRNFYDRPLGDVAARLIARRVERLWPDVRGLHLAGIGYAVPVMDRMSGDYASRIALMPARQGVVHWPGTSRNAAALVDEDALPLPDASFDRILLLHALEVAEHQRNLLREVWRILAPNGRLIVIVPRRRGVWAGFERTPFGSGQPYSSRQLEQVLASQLLPVANIRRSLFLPPLGILARPELMVAAEKLGTTVLRGLGGILIVEAEKQIYRAIEGGARVRPGFAAVNGPGQLLPPLAPTARGPVPQPRDRGNA